MELVCPITHEEIKEIGITCFGSIYEYDAIKSWFQNHSIDPSTNLHVPTKVIIKVPEHLKYRVSEIAAEYKRSTKL